MKKLRVLKRLNQQSPTGAYALALGARIGYWPCVGGPFVQFSFGKWVISIWYGTSNR